MIDRRAFLAGTTAAALPGLPALSETGQVREVDHPAEPAPPSVMDELDRTLGTMKRQIEKMQAFTAYARQVEQASIPEAERDRLLALAASQLSCFAGPLCSEGHYQHDVFLRLMEKLYPLERERKETAQNQPRSLINGMRADLVAIEEETARIRAHLDHLHTIEQRRGIEGKARMMVEEFDAPAMASLVTYARWQSESLRRRQNALLEQPTEAGT